MRRGEIRWARLTPTEGHEQAGHRPVLIVSEDRYIAARKIVLAFPLTTSTRIAAPIAIELLVHSDKRSFALPGQVRTLSVSRLGSLLATATEREMDACLDAFLQICGRRPPMRAHNDG